MKKFLILSILAVGVLASVAVQNPAPFALAIAGLAFMSSYKSADVAFISLVPAAMAGPAFTRAQKHLYDWLTKFSNQVTKEAINKGTIIWDPVTYYIRREITGLSGRQKLLGSSTTKEVGVTNLDKGVLPQYYNFCYDRITVRYGSSNTANSTVKTFAGYTSALSSMDPALRNGELIVSLNREVQVETPVADFGSAAAPTVSAREFDGGALECPKVWTENLQVEVELNLAGTVASTANTYFFVEVLFQGVQARLS